MNEPGAVFAEEAYALGKMLDHSAWQKGERRLPRGITSSDIDAVMCETEIVSNITVFDNFKRTIFVELSRQIDTWLHATTGQRMVYEAVLVGAPHCSVLCRHNVVPETGRKICTRFDVTSFQPMFYDHGIVLGNIYESNELWQDFVFSWFEDPLRLRRKLLAGKYQL